MKLAQTKATNACFTVALALALSLMLFLPAATAASTITLTSPNPILLGEFGASVAIDGSTVVVGAANEDSGTTANAGRAYVFDATTGDLVSTLTSPNPLASSNPQSGGEFGQSVSISDTTVVVGAPREMVGTTALAGHAYVFDATTGDLVHTLTSPNPETSGFFGLSVGVFVDDATVVVGAPGETVGTTSQAGRAHVFDATTGDLIHTLTSPNLQAGNFGHSVAISAMTVVVGAPGEESGTTLEAGNAYVFDATTGDLVSTLTSPSPGTAGEFGLSVGVFVDDATVVVGAPFETGGTPGLYPGQAYVFL